MANNIPAENYSKFFYELTTTISKTSLYPANHPAVAAAIKNVYLTLLEILKLKDTLTLHLSGENKIIVENEPLSEKTSHIEDIISYFGKLNIENITFGSGITEKEVEDLIKIMLLDKEEIKKISDINKLLLEKGIAHIKIDQYSYVKIDKGKEALVVEDKAAVLNALRAKIKDYSKGKIEKPEDIEAIEKEIFDMVVADFKDKKKLSASAKSIFKAFFLQAKDKEDVLAKLKNVLLSSGYSAQDADNLLKKLEEEILKEPQPRQLLISDEGIEKLKTENEGLRSKLNQLQQEINKKSASAEAIEKSTKKIIAEKQRLDNIIHHMTEGLVVVDPQGNLLMVNPIAEALLGVSKQDIGRPIKELVKDEHLLTLAKNIPRDKEEAIEKDIELFSPDESTKRILKTSSAVVEDPNGNTVGMVTILNDITKQKELEKLKSGFVANVSHELRTPLVAIDKSVSLILSKTAGEISPDQEQFLSIASRNLKRLTLLINDLLDLSKLEAGKMTLTPEITTIGKIIDESVKTFQNWAGQKSVKIAVKIAPEIPEINLDPNRIIQVLNNLLSNAVKFTPNNGNITVEAAMPPGKKEIEVSVTDTGIGIAKENLPKIFEKFYQVGEKAPNDISGTGIGLAVSKEIVELHGGKIWAESEEGRGTKFKFSLPLK